MMSKYTRLFLSLTLLTSTLNVVAQDSAPATGSASEAPAPATTPAQQARAQQFVDTVVKQMSLSKVKTAAALYGTLELARKAYAQFPADLQAEILKQMKNHPMLTKVTIGGTAVGALIATYFWGKTVFNYSSDKAAQAYEYTKKQAEQHPVIAGATGAVATMGVVGGTYMKRHAIADAGHTTASLAANGCKKAATGVKAGYAKLSKENARWAWSQAKTLASNGLTKAQNGLSYGKTWIKTHPKSVGVVGTVAVGGALYAARDTKAVKGAKNLLADTYNGVGNRVSSVVNKFKRQQPTPAPVVAQQQATPAEVVTLALANGATIALADNVTLTNENGTLRIVHAGNQYANPFMFSANGVLATVVNNVCAVSTNGTVTARYTVAQ